ncbi:MAG: hypothetical protein SGJ19_21610 [Planctomycetia bacterium]|nr:hypothetical protein [Planctomycetia bacterium]
MKIAIVSESPGDSLIVKILCAKILGFPIDVVTLKRSADGFAAAKESLKVAYRQLHYRREAQVMIACVDADNSYPHLSNCGDPRCRHCDISSMLDQEERHAKPNSAFPTPIQCFVAVPPPSIEAWLMAHRDNNCREALWRSQPISRRDSANAIRQQKISLYGKLRPSDQEREGAAIAAANDIALIEQCYPNSFGQLASALRGNLGIT